MSKAVDMGSVGVPLRYNISLFEVKKTSMKKLTKPLWVTASLFALTFVSTTMAETYNVTENTNLSELNAKLGAPVRTLIGDAKTADFLDIHKYTFLDAYKNTFGVVVSGKAAQVYRLSAALTTQNLAPFFSIRSQEQSGDVNVQEVTLMGIKLGMNAQDATQRLYQLPSFDSVTAAQDGSTEYQLSNGSHIKLHADKRDSIAEVELYLNADTAN